MAHHASRSKLPWQDYTGGETYREASILVIRPDREDLLLRRGDVLGLDDVIPELRLYLSALSDELRHELGP